MVKSSLVYYLNPSRVDWKIRVKVLRKWTSRDRLLQVIVCDKNGYKIQATLDHVTESMFSDSLDEGTWKVLQNFIVVHKSGLERNTYHDYHIFLKDDTIVRNNYSVNDDHMMDFIKFDRIRLTSENYPIDLIGVVSRVDPLHVIPNSSTKKEYNEISLWIRDEFNFRVKCTAYGSLALRFYSWYPGTTNPPNMVALRFWRVTSDLFCTLNVTSVDCSDFLVNPQILDANIHIFVFPHIYLNGKFL